MQQLTFNYESAIYQKGQAAAEWKKSGTTLWEVLMKKATSPPKSNDFHSAI